MNMNLIRKRPESARAVYEAVTLAVKNWPNAHLGDCTYREDLRSAFLFIRRRVNTGMDLFQACCELESDAYRYSDC